MLELKFTISYFYGIALIYTTIMSLVAANIIKKSPSPEVSRMAFHVAMMQFTPPFSTIVMALFIVLYWIKFGGV